MSGSTSVALWHTAGPPSVPDRLSDPAQLVTFALQLRDRERTQLAHSFLSESYEVGATFVWTRSMALLRKQLASLGSEFIGELIQRPGVDEHTDIASILTDFETISLARDLGLVSGTQAMRLFHSREIVAHFAGASGEPIDPDEEMTREDAVSCLRICVQTVLAQENVNAAEDFKKFRQRLSSQTFTDDSDEVVKLLGSPYLFVRTAVSVLISLFRTEKGAQLEHTSRNALLIIPKLWPKLKAPEKWQIGQAYATEFGDGRKDAVRGLHAVLTAVAGFDYVPETLRSSTFIKTAQNVIAAHQGMNNFYNEAAPMRELASLGTSIPGPAVAISITAALCVKLGNSYGVAWAAQDSADVVLRNLSSDRWLYYFNERLDQDRIVLAKLTSEKTAQRWVELIKPLKIDASQISAKGVRELAIATLAGNVIKVTTLGRTLFSSSIAA
ncbi:hypothetical protein [uncultured Novosphingobium sp.]|uniref:hypothetical protein n=1 Tax=uncultured Novosphingobium sp. TaxID=292277 RepID=UPI00258ED1F2|nr:hypothetical protein [uncultured Novosphingobium sp.]